MKVLSIATALGLAACCGALPARAQLPDRNPQRTAAQVIASRQATQAEYERMKESTADTPDDQWQLSEWCRQNRLLTQRQEHLQRVIELDPEHAAARRALGFQKHSGRWVTQEELMTERGYVRYKGRWRLPQEVKQLEEKRKNTASENQWVGNLKRWREMLGDDRYQDAMANIQGINDPYALRALEDQLKEEPNEQVRALYLKALANIDTPESVRLLVRASIHDPADECRLTAIDYLAEKKYPEVVALYIQSLRDKNNTVINRAAIGLASMENPAAVPALIDALVTSHTETIVTGSPGISSTFSRDGKNAPPQLNGFSTGQSTVQVTQHLRNAGVLDALIALTGVNYDFDIERWKAWLQSRKKGESLDQRRS